MLTNELKRRFHPDVRRVRSRIHTRDGRSLRCRLMNPHDAPLLIDLFDSLSVESKRRRFHYAVDLTPRALVLEEAERLSAVDNRTTAGAVVALENDEGRDRIIGVARLMRPPSEPESPDAEAAIVVRDDYQGQGVGKELLRRMVLLAKAMHVRTIVAEIEADNHSAIMAFRKLGLPTTSTTTHAETTLRISVPYD